MTQQLDINEMEELIGFFRTEFDWAIAEENFIEDFSGQDIDIYITKCKEQVKLREKLFGTDEGWWASLREQLVERKEFEQEETDARGHRDR